MIAGTAVLTCFPFITGAAQLGADDAAAWREDLKYLATELERRHKNLYHTVSKEAFGAMVDALDERIPSLQRHEVVVELARIVAAVGDGHTSIDPTRDPKIGFQALPVALSFFGEELWVRAAHESRQELVGARVVRIGDRTVPEAFEAVKAVIGRDNDSGARFLAQYLLAMPEVLHALKLSPSVADVTLTLAGERGEERVVLHPFEPAGIRGGHVVNLYDRRKGWVDLRDRSKRPEPAWLRGTGQAFNLERIGDLLYVQINEIGDQPGETFPQFAERLRGEIAASKPGKVALDLRLNRGGNGMLIPPLVRALVQSTEVDREGRLFAIIGPATFSAAQMLADALEKYTNVTFVGEPTGSKGNAYGDSRKFELPRSGLTVRASIFYWQDWHPSDDRVATMPEIPAPLTIEAYRDNVDPSIEAIRRLPR